MPLSDSRGTTRTPLLTVRDLSVDYVTKGKAPAHALEAVSFTLHQGEVLGIVGESGCGKTTLMLSLMRLLPAAGRIIGGQVVLHGQDLLSLSEANMQAVRWKQIAMIFQGAMNALNPVRTVGSQIAEPIGYHATPVGGIRLPQGHRTPRNPVGNRVDEAMGGRSLTTIQGMDPTRTLGNQIADAITAHEARTDKRLLRNRVAELLALVGINPNRQDQYPHQYSGGMRQRAMIAMALACNPDVIIADEPTTALDVMVQAQILELLSSLCRTLGLSVLFVTHDLGVVAEICDSVLVMYGGVVAEYSDVDTIFNGPKHPYTQELLKAFPDLAKPNVRLQAIPGAPPALDALPAGCRFAPRCPAAIERCHHTQPLLYRLGAFHEVSCHLATPDAGPDDTVVTAK